ncbi:MAG: hypothetical protein AAFQ94_03045 [Bacteroidota bacterium]
MKNCYFYLILIALVAFSCNSTRTDEKEGSKTEGSESPIKQGKTSNKVKGANQVDLAEAIEKGISGNYMVALMDSVLAMLDPRSLYNPFFGTDSLSLTRLLKDYQVAYETSGDDDLVFSKDDSQLLINYWEVDELSAEYQQLSGTYVKGFLRDPDIEFSSGLRVGMSKPDFFSTYFSRYENFFDSIELILIYEDVRANDATVYRFQNDTLAEIELGNVSLTY